MGPACLQDGARARRKLQIFKDHVVRSTASAGVVSSVFNRGMARGALHRFSMFQ